jgi:hypothetical protein
LYNDLGFSIRVVEGDVLRLREHSMVGIRRSKRATIAASAALLVCASKLGAVDVESRDDRAFVDLERANAHNLEYLRWTTRSFIAHDPINVLAHLERSRVDLTYRAPGIVPFGAWDHLLTRMSDLVDTRDFDALYLMHIALGYADHPMLAPGLTAKVERALIDFKYWYTEPTRIGKVDASYYWSENHQLIYSTVEYLMGQRHPRATFGNDGRSGSEHCDAARERLLRWFEYRSRFGFSEWHSNVYYEKDVTPLLALVDFAADPDMRVLAASMLDTLFFDMALHNQKGAFGVTHGRSYKKDKMSSLDEDTWDITKLAFDNTTYPFSGGAGGVLLARNHRYRLPEAIRRIAVSPDTFVDRERMGIATRETGPVDASVQAPYGLSYTDPAFVDLWWGMNAFAAWPVMPLTLQVMQASKLWDNPQLAALQLLRRFVGPKMPMFILSTTAPETDLFLLNEVNTYTWRSPDVMLSSAIDYRKGFRGAQVHAWQATLDANAIVFTNHPAVPLPDSTDWLDDPETGGYWNGEASLPRSAQQENVAIHIYAPQYRPVNRPPLDSFSYQPFTHAYFPQDRFDEVAKQGHWTFGRLGDGYVALYSYRAAEFRQYDPARNAMGGHAMPFDLVALGGADNVWIVECGRRARWGSFAAFQRAIVASGVEVTPRNEEARGFSSGFDVVYRSPSQGEMRFGWASPFIVGGRERALGPYARFDNPWARVDFDSRALEIRHGRHGVKLDFAAKIREVF